MQKQTNATIDWTSVIPSTAYLPTPNPSGVTAPAVLDAETAIILKNKLSSAVATIRGLGKYFGHTLDPDIVDPFDVIHELLNQYSHEDPQSDLGVALAHSALLYSQYSEFVR